MNGIFHHHRFLCIKFGLSSKTFKESLAEKPKPLTVQTVTSLLSQALHEQQEKRN